MPQHRSARGEATVHRLLRAGLLAALLLIGTAGTGNADDRTFIRDERPVVLVLDASGSMATPLGRESRLDAARRVVLDTLTLFSAKRPAGLVAYGHRRKDDCTDIETLQKIAPVDVPAIRKSLSALRPTGMTPLSAALRHAAGLLSADGGVVMLVSDGLENCREDPCAVVDALKRANAKLVFHVVGFGMADGEMKRLACIADKGGGRAIETRDATRLEQALKTLVETPPPSAAPPVAPEPPAQTMEKPVLPPPPTPKPVTLRAMVGGAAVPGPVLFTVTGKNGETVYEGKGIEVRPDLVPGPYRVRVTIANARSDADLTVTGAPDERHGVALAAGFASLSVIAAHGLDLKDTDLKGDPIWTLVPKDGQAPAELDPVLAPAAMLAPGRYDVAVSLGGFTARNEIVVAAGKSMQATLDLDLGKVTLEAAAAGADRPLDSGAGLSWSLEPANAGPPPLRAEAVARPTFLVAAGPYKAHLVIAGATLSQDVVAQSGKTMTVRLDLPAAELVLTGALGPDAPPFTDWRDATWTVRPVKLIGDVKAGPALENKAEASPALVLTPGEWEVTLVSGGASTTRRLTVVPGAKAAERIDLAAGRLSVSAAPPPDAAPPLNVVISFFRGMPDGAFAEKPIVEAGTRRDFAAILPAGRYRIAAADETGRTGTAVVELKAGESATQEIALK